MCNEEKYLDKNYLTFLSYKDVNTFEIWSQEWTYRLCKLNNNNNINNNNSSV